MKRFSVGRVTMLLILALLLTVAMIKVNAQQAKQGGTVRLERMLNPPVEQEEPAKQQR